MITLKDARRILNQMIGYRPSDTIVQRGIKLFDSGAVAGFSQIKSDIFQVEVNGETDDYILNIQTKRTKDPFVECSCPYDQDVYCKHGVAAILQIFSDDQDVRKNKKTAPISLSEILSKVSPKEMTEFLLAKAEYDLGFQEELRNYFTLSKDDSELYYKRTAEGIFRSLAGRNHFIDYQASFSYEKKMSRLIEKAETLVRVKPKEALYIAHACSESVFKASQQMDDSSGLIGSLIDSCQQIIRNVADTNKNNQADVLKICLSLYENEIAKDLGFSEDYFDMIVSMELPSDSLEFLLKILKKKIKTEKNDSYQMKKTVLHTYSVLKKLNRESEGLSFLKSYITHPEVRVIFIEQCISEDRFAEAEKFISEGIQIAQKKKQPGIVIQWKEDLLKLMEIQGQKVSAFQIAKDLFLEDCDNEYKLAMQRNHPKKDWKKTADEIANYILTRSVYFHRYGAIEFLLKEGFVEETLEKLQKDNSHTFFDFYSEFVPKQELRALEIALKYIEEEAKTISSRSGYKRLTQKMKLVARSKLGKKKIVSLTDRFTFLYKHRPAMIDELKKAKFI
ncbi:SWIM zinc finger family protein [Leptospira santarosai]|uniref:SWIM zinc finger family protein n=1 Tax=Leptospira santarosai TaxID=28183 RepID=UPI0024AEC7B1|nr:hypothetical protein [Leptospira santarosai]